MGNTISRRKLLRTGALLAGGLPFAGSLLKKVQAAPSVTGTAFSHHAEAGWTERDIALRSAEPLKARLFANENPFGPSEAAKKAIVETLPVSYQYPFRTTDDLTGRISTFEKIDKGNIVLAAGSSPLLRAAALAYLRPGCNVVSGDPTYADLPSSAERVGARWVKVPLTKDFALDLDAMEKAVDENTVLVYICNPNNPTGTVVDTSKLRAFCERVSKKAAVFLDEAYNSLYTSEQMINKLAGYFAFIAIFICCLGLLGLVMFTAEQRIKEIGIRKVLGANTASVFGLLSKDFLVLVFIAFVIASPLAWWAANNWLTGFAYRIHISWWIFLLAGFLAMIIALATISVQALKAAMANPVKSLRTE